MKKFITAGITIIALIFIVTSFGWTQTATDSYQMKKIVYGAEVDSKMAFYQKRIYLVDSEYKILSEIGQDAVKKIHFLTAYRKQLVDHMLTSNVPLKKAKMNSFLGSKLNTISATMEAYSTE